MSDLFRLAAVLNMIGAILNGSGMIFLSTVQNLWVSIGFIGIGGATVLTSLILMIVDHFKDKRTG